MDFKFKSKSWVGNFCQKFEFMCHEVDNLMSEDTVRYMENQVQTVGGNLKQLYSGIVRDLSSNSAHPTTHKAEAVVQKRNAAQVTSTAPMIVKEENQIDTVNKQLLVETSTSYPVNNQLAHGINEHQTVNQDINLIPAVTLENLMFDSTQQQFDGNKTEEKPDQDIDLIPAVTLESLMFDSIRQQFDCNKAEEKPYQDIDLIPVVTLENLMLQQFDDNKTEEKSDSPTENIAINEKSPSPELLQFATPDEEACFNATVNDSIDWEKLWRLQTNVSPETSIHGEEFHSLRKESDDFTDICDYSEVDFSSSEKDIAEMGLNSSVSNHSVENSLVDNCSNALPCNDPVDVAQSGSEQPDALQNLTSASLVPCNNDVAQNGVITSSSVLPFEDSGKSSECYEDIKDPEMESIDLCDNVKLQDICIFANDSQLHAVSCRTQKLRSVKKKIQDAFSSRKRLAKEYEQIAIWYGDIDVESSQCTSHTHLPTTFVTLEPDSSGAQDISDWELL